MWRICAHLLAGGGGNLIGKLKHSVEFRILQLAEGIERKMVMVIEPRQQSGHERVPSADGINEGGRPGMERALSRAFGIRRRFPIPIPGCWPPTT